MTATRNELELRRIDEIHEHQLNQSLELLQRNRTELEELIQHFQEKETVILDNYSRFLTATALAVVNSILLRIETKEVLSYGREK